MINPKTLGPRPMNVFVRPGSKAELTCRRYGARQKVPSKDPPPQAEVIAPGFSPRSALNLVGHNGKIIRDLVYTSFFVGGDAWDPRMFNESTETLLMPWPTST
jgi:hypothetical protein